MATFDSAGRPLDPGYNPQPGELIRETGPDGVTVFVKGLLPGDNANTLAAFLTIGGWDYGQAVANYNGWDWPLGDSAVSHGAKLAIVPAEWMKPNFLQRAGVAETIAQNVVQDAQQTTVDATQTVQDLAQRAGDAISGALSTGATIGKWLIMGLVAVAIIEALSFVPRPSYARRTVRTYRRRAARAVARRIAGD